jgi:hypothetical protein
MCKVHSDAEKEHIEKLLIKFNFLTSGQNHVSGKMRNQDFRTLYKISKKKKIKKE